MNIHKAENGYLVTESCSTKIWIAANLADLMLLIAQRWEQVEPKIEAPSPVVYRHILHK